MHTYPNHIHVDALTIRPAGLDASCLKSVPICQSGFQRHTDAVIICGVHVGRDGNLTLCGLVRGVFGAGGRELPLPLPFGLLRQRGTLR